MTNCFSAFRQLYLFIFSILQITSDIYSFDIRLLYISQYHFRHLSNWDLTFVIWHLTSDTRLLYISHYHFPVFRFRWECVQRCCLRHARGVHWTIVNLFIFFNSQYGEGGGKSAAGGSAPKPVDVPKFWKRGNVGTSPGL